MDEDIIAVLEEHHVRIRDLMAQVRSRAGQPRQDAFDQLRALLAAHETAEELLLRPFSAEHAGPAVAGDRNAEEAAANRVLAQLEHLDVDSARFTELFAGFERDVLAHAAAEEREEFPAVRRDRDPEELQGLARAVRLVERVGPTHAHPAVAGSTAAQWTVGPFFALLDRARDALAAATR